MIYLDNAATSYPKHESVSRKMEEVMRYIGGSPGRGSHKMALSANRIVFGARESIARLLNIKDSSRIVFTKNATEAINLALKGLLKAGDHVITTNIEHNSVTRTLSRLEDAGVKVTTIPAEDNGNVDIKKIENAMRADTKLVCVTHASNVFGTIIPVSELGDLCSQKCILLMVDAAQTLGSVPMDIELMNIDILAATGHKALLGPQGTGFLYIKEGIEPLPLIDGGTGEDENMEEMPESLESGTLNTPSIGGLMAGVEFILREDVRKIRAYEKGLISHLLSELTKIDVVNILRKHSAKERASLVSFNIEGREPGEISYILDERFSIMTRSGLHCAPLAHKAAGTYPGGAIRVSPGYLNTPNDIEEFIKAIKEIVGNRR